LLIGPPAEAQFGRNKVQYKDHHWQVLTTPHFEVHFDEGSERFAGRAALVLEDGYRMLSEKLNETLPWRVPIILYSNHNDFLQTNISNGLLPEGVQAFAEPSRKRIVLPFTGSYPAFWHTAIHELAHVFTFQIVYNRLMDNVFSRNALFGMPPWVAEGVAEYLSVEWDTEADMFIRDAVIHDYLPDLSRASGFIVYKGGQSAFNYIADTYGKEKVLEILDALSVTRNSDGALEKTIGLTTSEFSIRWKKAMRKKYWPMYGDKTEVEDLGRRLTNHIKDRGYYNTKPVMSPDGERIAFFSDRGGLISIYVMSTIDGKILKKLVGGHRSNRFESLHFFTSSLAWSPDGERIAFIAKSDGRDQVYIVDSRKGKVKKKIDVEADGVASPAWSPDGATIIVSAVFAGQTDLVSIEVENGGFKRLTSDTADQLNPTFFPDGKRIAFVHFPDVTVNVPSDLSAEARRALSEMDFLGLDNVRHDVDRDIYEMDLETGATKPLVETEGDDLSPVVFDDGKKMIFTSDASGIRNLYVADLEVGEYRRVTDVLSGVLAPDVNDENRRITFTAFVKAGYDIYVSDDLDALLENNFDSAPLAAVRKQKQLSGRILREGFVGPDIPLSTILARKAEKAGPSGEDDLVFSVSDEDSLRDIGVTPRRPQVSLEKSGETIEPSRKEGLPGKPIEGLETAVSSDEPATRGGSVSKYKLKLAPDFIGQGAGLYFSTGFGFGLANTIAMSDLLANHRVVVSFNLFRDIADSDLLATYLYLKNRINYGIGVFQFKNYLNSRMTSIGESFRDYRLFTERNYGVFGLVSYPFDTFNRLDFEVQGFVSERQFFEQSLLDDQTDLIVYERGEKSRRNLIEPTLSFVHDASFFSYFGPIDGSRYNISVSRGFGLGSEGVSRSTLFVDYRWYKHIFYRNSLAFRVAFAGSEGDDPRTFFLGGPTTLRGYDYLDFEGSRIGIGSLEYRFPLVDALIFGWPGRWGIGNINGSVFFDVGAAWDKDDINPFRNDISGLQFDDLRGDFGFGTHLYMGFFLLNFQLAWKTDLQSVRDTPQFHFFLGPSF
jgi:Tol biopolymer transport system component